MPKPSDAFKAQAADAFAQIDVGKTFQFSRTFTEADNSLFCGLSGDFNPLHLDEGFAAGSPFGRRILPGQLTASMVTHVGGMIGFVASEMKFEYLKPVYPGDTVTCRVTFTAKDEAKRRMSAEATLTNQEGVVVIRAAFSGFPTLVRLR